MQIDRVFHARRQRQAGQAVVEGTLVLLVFTCLMIGTVDFGQFLFLHQSLTERVRVAARYGATQTYDYPGDNIRNVAVYGTPNPPNGATSIVPNLTMEMVTAQIIAEGTDASRIRITISNYPFRYFSPWISRQATARTIIGSAPYEHGL